MQTLARYAFAVFFVGAGLNHFLHPAFYLQIMPPYLPAHDALNVVSGAAEIIIGVLVAVPRTQRIGGWLAIVLLVAVFPANIYLFTHQELMPDVPALMHLLRLPLQALFIAWAYWAALARSRSRAPEAANHFQ